MRRLQMMKSFNFVLLYAGVVFSAQPRTRPQESNYIDLTGPSCSPSDTAKNTASWSRCPLGQDINAWYGLTNEALDYYDAAKMCDSFGAQLVSTSDPMIDFCAASTIDINRSFDQMVLYSGRYSLGFSSWVWCDGDECDSSFDYVNWDNSSSSEGKCMGGYFQDYDAVRSSGGISGYGWIQRDCKEVSVRALCRLDCDSDGAVTTQQVTTVEGTTEQATDAPTDTPTPVTTELVTTLETTTEVMKKQLLMYTLRSSQKIYSYKLDVDRDPVKNGQFTIPFSTGLPGLVFNLQLQCLEIIGDWFDSSLNKNHQMMTTTGSFSEASGSLFNGEYKFEVCHSKSAGTLVISGYGHSGKTQVYIITQNTNWNTIESSDKYLSSFQNPSPNSDYWGFGVAELDDKIYLIGGTSGGYQTTIKVLDLENSESLQQAQSRQWSFLTSLKNGVYTPAVIYSNDQLLIVGNTKSSSTSKDVQYLSLASNTTGVYPSIIDYGDSSDGFCHPGMYNIAGGNVSIFGGDKALGNCIQQISPTYDLDSEWDCLSSSESALEGLGYFGDGSSGNIRYANFVV